MAEVLGITSGIIAVLHLAAKVTTLSNGYISAVKRASKDLIELRMSSVYLRKFSGP